MIFIPLTARTNDCSYTTHTYWFIFNTVGNTFILWMAFLFLCYHWEITYHHFFHLFPPSVPLIPVSSELPSSFLHLSIFFPTFSPLLVSCLALSLLQLSSCLRWPLCSFPPSVFFPQICFLFQCTPPPTCLSFTCHLPSIPLYIYCYSSSLPDSSNLSNSGLSSPPLPCVLARSGLVLQVLDEVLLSLVFTVRSSKVNKA